MSDDDELRGWATQLRKGLAELCVLACLRDGEAYGYALLQRLAGLPGLAVTESTLYPFLNRAAEAGWVEVSHRPSTSGPPRRYYRLTPSGHGRLAVMATSWRRTTGSVEQLLPPGESDD